MNDEAGYIDYGKCIIWYLGHSGWAVKTEKHFLIFDYTKINTNIQGKQIHNSLIELIDLKDENVYVFVTHEHDDHYDKTILDWAESVKKIKYITGWNNPSVINGISVGGNRDLKIDDMEISTITATDDGVGFLVIVDGLSILHLGDHANWCEELDDIYKKEINYIAERCGSVDIAFTPVAKGSGVRTQSITDGVEYLINKLGPGLVFPMHGGGREYLYKEFAEDIKFKTGDSEVICAVNPDDKWEFPLR